MMEAMAEGMTFPPVTTLSGYGYVRGGGHDHDQVVGGWGWDHEGQWQGAHGRVGAAEWPGVGGGDGCEDWRELPHGQDRGRQLRAGGYCGGPVAGHNRAGAAPWQGGVGGDVWEGSQQHGGYQGGGQRRQGGSCRQKHWN